MNKPYPLSLCDLCQISLQFQDLKWRAIIDLQYRVIGNLLVFGQFPFPVFRDHTPDFLHAFYDKHPGIAKVVFRSVSILPQEGIVLCIKGINGVQQASQMVIECPRQTNMYRLAFASIFVPSI